MRYVGIYVTYWRSCRSVTKHIRIKTTGGGGGSRGQRARVFHKRAGRWHIYIIDRTAPCRTKKRTGIDSKAPKTKSSSHLYYRRLDPIPGAADSSVNSLAA
ncbi:unnamed protein product [Ectocarpus sp. 13 AM-2016]